MIPVALVFYMGKIHRDHEGGGGMNQARFDWAASRLVIEPVTEARARHPSSWPSTAGMATST